LSRLNWFKKIGKFLDSISDPDNYDPCWDTDNYDPCWDTDNYDPCWRENEILEILREINKKLDKK
jgi:hypothetical protein